MAQSDMTSQLMDDMDQGLLDFLREKVNSFIKWDLVRFFHDNPHAADTAESIARFTGRDVRTIEDELAGLVDANVLQKREMSGVKIYTLAQEESMQELIRQFVRACDDRQFRVKAIYHVIRGLRSVTPLSFNQFLMLYTWFPLAALLFLLLLIARFYEKFSGEQTYFKFFTMPIVLFGAATVRYASINRMAGDIWADVLMGMGGVILMVMCLLLYRRMTAGR
jgi:hypothetical protein